MTWISTILMISISSLLSVGYAEREARELRYYLNDAEGLAPSWLGGGVEALGLEAKTVSRDRLRAVFAGLAPDGTRLVQAHRKHQRGWDMTSNSPKAATCLQVLGPKEVRSEVRAAEEAADRWFACYVEKEHLLTRRGRGGAVVERAVGALVARVPHLRNRADEPHSHRHHLWANAALRPDGSFGTILSRPFYENQRSFSALWDCEFAFQLTRRLGIKLEKKPVGFGICGVSGELVDSFSKRTRAIDDLERDFGVRSAKLREKLVLETREKKRPSKPGELEARWRELAREHDFGEKEIRSLLHLRRPLSEERQSHLAYRAARIALREIAQEQDRFTAADLAGHSARALTHRGVSAEAVLRAAARVLELGEVRVLGETRGVTYYTTHEHFELQHRMLREADQAKQDSSHRLSERKVERAIAKASHLSAEQGLAIRAHTSKANGLDCLWGGPGSGKTTTIGVISQLYRQSGYQVLAAAPTARAARELRDGAAITGACTVAKLLQELEPSASALALHHARQLLRAAGGRKTFRWKAPKLGRKTLLIVDEAAMTSTTHLARLVHLVRRRGGRLLLVGDPDQLQPVLAPGGAFKEIALRTGCARLAENRRQIASWEQFAIGQLAAGDARGALSSYSKHGRLHFAESRSAAKDALVERWLKECSASPEENLVIAFSKADVRDLNGRIQAKRLERGELGHKAIASPDGTLFREGDRLLFRRNSPQLAVSNGDFGTVLGVRHSTLLSGAKLSVKLDSGRQVIVELDDERALQLGYATTAHAVQGTTSKNTLLLAGGRAQDAHSSYVAATRARERTDFFLDPTSAGEDLDDLVRALQRRHEKELAIASLHKLQP